MADCNKCAHFLTCKHYKTNFYSCAQFMSYENTVEVVRCKDCKHYGLGACLKIYSDGAASVYAWQYRKPDDFCSYGERRADDADRTET